MSADVAVIATPAPGDAGAPLAGRVGRAVAWSALSTWVLRLGQFLMGIVIARLVAPHEFGVFVVALTVYTIVINVSEVGVSAALVREVHRSREIAPTVATIALTTSALLTTLMVVVASPVSTALGSSAATSSVQVLSLTVLLAGAGAVPSALMTRDFRQKRMFAINAAFFVSSNALLVVLAMGGGGALALAWSRVAGQVVSTALLLYFSPERYWPGFNRREAKHLLRFGLPLAGANLINLALANLDFIVIGRLRGALRLGYYNLAYNISGWPVSVFSAVLTSVTLPTLARVREVQAELLAHLRAGLSALAAAAFPVSALSIALAPSLVDTVYGQRWGPAAVALMALSAFGAIRVVIALLADLLVALGFTQRLFLIQVVWLAALVPAMIFGVSRWGIVGAGIANTAVGLLVVLPCYLVIIRRSARLPLGWLVGSSVPPLAAASVAGVVARVVADRIPSAPLALIVGAVCGISCYVVVLFGWLRRTIRTLRRLYGRSGGYPPRHATGLATKVPEPAP
ncbi:MAG TPA: oligosaccharide flippase family protein [Micromonosporaceae bacterium]